MRDPLLTVGLVTALVGGCGSGSSPDSDPDPGPIGPVARNAAEAWPTRPSEVPVLTPEQIVSACARRVACLDEPRDTPAEGVGACVGQVEWSAERAIPLSALMPSWERPEYFVHCVLDAADCAQVVECAHSRREGIYCEEDGCRIRDGADFEVTCEGDVATLERGGRRFERDCTTAFARCDAESPTGCTDRLFTACPPDGDRSDRCDGGIRLGCDSHEQVSYRDCSRMGGTCGETPDGALRCLYGEGDPECTDGNVIFSYCEGENVVACATGKRTVVPAPELCAPESP